MLNNYCLRYPAWFLLILFLINSNTLPQPDDIRFEHITIKDGLPSNLVYNILQDHLGFMWFCTDAGLVRYDGYEMRVYQSKIGDSSSLADNDVMQIYEDRLGYIWAGTIERKTAVLNRFDRASGKFKQYKVEAEDTVTNQPNLVLALFEDSKGRFWVGTNYGLILLDRKSGSVKTFYYKRKGYSNEVYLFLDSLSRKGKTLCSIEHPGNNVNITDEFVLNKEQDILFASMGEENLDYGWMTDNYGNSIIKYDIDSTLYDGEYVGNRMQISVRKLPPGKYVIHFKSDKGHAYNEWDAPAPDHPEYWGVKVYTLDGIENDIKPILSKFHFTRLKYHFVVTIAEERNTGDILIGGLPGLWKLDEMNEVISQIPTSMFIYNIRSFHQLDDSSILAASSRGLYKYNPVTNGLKLYRLVPTEEYVPENELLGGMAEIDGLIFTGAMSGQLLCFNPETEQFRTCNSDPDNKNSLSPSSPVGIRAITMDKSGILWVSTSEFGLNKWDRFKPKFNSYKYDKDLTKSLGSNEVMSMIEDRSGMIWIGTYGGGLVKYNRNGNSFTHYKHDPYIGNSLSDDLVMAICEDPEEDGVLWIGTENGGLNRFDSRINTFKHFVHDPKEDDNSRGNNNVMFILPDGKDNLWISTLGGGLKEFNLKTSKWKRYLNIRKTGKWRSFLNDPEGSTSISSNRVWYSYKDKLGALWVGTINDPPGGGLNRFDYISQTFKSFSTLNKNWNPNAVTVICEDMHENFWVGDYTSGLYLFDREKQEYVLNLTQTEGLPNNAVMSILEDDSGNLWISTVNGLSKYNQQAGSFRNYYEEDGLNSSKFSFRCAFKSKDGELFFGGENGFTWFKPEDIIDDPAQPLVVIDKLSLFNRPDEKLKIDGFISEMETVEFPYNQNDLRFDYVGLHYGEPQKNKYKYILENFDKDWVDAGTQRNAIYTNLDPGEYVFRVKAANMDGVWNEEGKSLKIIIHPPFWATWWFRGCGIILIIGFMGYVRQRKILKIKKEMQIQAEFTKQLIESQEKERKRIAGELHDSLGQNLLIIKNKALMGKKNPEKNQKLIDDISELSSSTLEEVREISYNLHPYQLESLGLTRAIESITEKAESSTGIKFENDLDLIDNILSPEAEINVYRIIQECVNNIIKHSNASKVKLKIKREIEKLFITISDNGRGYDVSAALSGRSKMSLGLMDITERAKLLGGKVTFESIKGKGSGCSIVLTLKKN